MLDFLAVFVHTKPSDRDGVVQSPIYGLPYEYTEWVEARFKKSQGDRAEYWVTAMANFIPF